MPSVGKMISDVELRLSHGKPSDDFSVTREQIRFWIGLLIPQVQHD